MKKCPHCEEEIHELAKKCKFCKEFIETSELQVVDNKIDVVNKDTDIEIIEEKLREIKGVWNEMIMLDINSIYCHSTGLFMDTRLMMSIMAYVWWSIEYRESIRNQHMAPPDIDQNIIITALNGDFIPLCKEKIEKCETIYEKYKKFYIQHKNISTKDEVTKKLEEYKNILNYMQEGIIHLKKVLKLSEETLWVLKWRMYQWFFIFWIIIIVIIIIIASN